MNFKHEVTVKISKLELEELIKKALNVPSHAQIYFDLATVDSDYGMRDSSYQVFNATRVVYTVDPNGSNRPVFEVYKR